jgi:hypothetical protein
MSDCSDVLPRIKLFDRGRGDGILGSERNKYRIDSCGAKKYYFSSRIWSLPNKDLILYKQSVLVQNKLNLLLIIILYNTLTLQLFTINKANYIVNYVQKIIKRGQFD